MAYIHQVNVNGTNYLIEPTLFITPTFNNNAYTATLTNFTLATGVAVQVQFNTTNSATNPTLSINSETAKTILHAGSAIPTSYLKVGYIYTLVYDGTTWEIVGDVIDDSIRIPIERWVGTGA